MLDWDAEWGLRFESRVFKYIGLRVYPDHDKLIHVFAVLKVEEWITVARLLDIWFILGGHRSISSFCNIQRDATTSAVYEGEYAVLVSSFVRFGPGRSAEPSGY